jgi:hypothetical protein
MTCQLPQVCACVCACCCFVATRVVRLATCAFRNKPSHSFPFTEFREYLCDRFFGFLVWALSPVQQGDIPMVWQRCHPLPASTAPQEVRACRARAGMLSKTRNRVGVRWTMVRVRVGNLWWANPLWPTQFPASPCRFFPHFPPTATATVGKTPNGHKFTRPRNLPFTTHPHLPRLHHLMATQGPPVTAKAGELPSPLVLAPPTLLGRVSVAVDAALRRVFEALGLFVAARPWTVIITSFLIAGLLTLGMLNQTVQNNGEKLWAPQSSIAAKDRCVGPGVPLCVLRLLATP